MFPCARVRSRVGREVNVVGQMNDAKALFNQTTDQRAQCVTVLSRGRNRRVYFLPIINPRLILVSHFPPINVMVLEGVPFPIPILLTETDEKRVGASEIVETVGAYD